MSEEFVWEVYCVTDSQWETVKQLAQPTVCPVNAGHTIRSVHKKEIDVVEFGCTNTAVLNQTVKLLVGPTTNRTLTVEDISDEIVLRDDAITLTNKTITAASNIVEANQLRTTGAAVVISGAAPPTTGQTLVATSATTATWQTPAGGGGGEANTASNVGAGGVGVFKQKTGVNLEFRNINVGEGISVTNDAANNEIDIGLNINGLTTDPTPVGSTDYIATYDASAGGHKKVLINSLPANEANTASNVGVGGVGVFKQKTGVNLEFRNINVGEGIAVTNDAANNEIDVGLNINGLTADPTPVGSTDYVATYDASAGGHKKVLINNLPANEANTASNVNVGGVGVFKQKTGVNLEFKGIVAGTNITVTENVPNNTIVIGTGGAGASPYVVFRDVKPSGTNGGTFNSGAWVTRDLTSTSGTLGGTSLASNQMTIPSGTYRITASGPAQRVKEHQIRLFNVTDAVVVVEGQNAYTNGSVVTNSLILATFTIASSKVMEIHHRCGSSRNTDGFGRATGFGGDEIYTLVEFVQIIP